MKKQFLECGKIVTTHGIKGEVRVQPWCDGPDFLTDFETLYFDRGEKPFTVERARAHKNVVVLKIAGVDTVEDAVKLRSRTVYVNRDDVELAEGESFVQDLIGCVVTDIDTGAAYGEIYDVMQTGANDVYCLKDEKGTERLVPAIPSVVLERDLDAGIVKIRPLEGLFDD
ncbi:ribosome maturation factor RimM [Anaerotruncus rubiinfantis]|uniref:ribosome maturation factor RimM n=1 Tax=Anaerotruncus rubiinfantis TaxID=1720200 RepID=UPI00082F815D|nr:ribosome maturation factor RimM [Anaerotruncus rubiinfantis]